MNVRLGTFTECGSRARGFRREGLVVATRAREKMSAVNVSVEAVIASGPETLRSSQVGDAAATAAPAAGREARAVAVTLGATDPFESSARRTRAPRRSAPGGRSPRGTARRPARASRTMPGAGVPHPRHVQQECDTQAERDDRAPLGEVSLGTHAYWSRLV